MYDLWFFQKIYGGAEIPWPNDSLFSCIWNTGEFEFRTLQSHSFRRVSNWMDTLRVIALSTKRLRQWSTDRYGNQYPCNGQIINFAYWLNFFKYWQYIWDIRLLKSQRSLIVWFTFMKNELKCGQCTIHISEWGEVQIANSWDAVQLMLIGFWILFGWTLSTSDIYQIFSDSIEQLVYHSPPLRHLAAIRCFVVLYLRQKDHCAYLVGSRASTWCIVCVALLRKHRNYWRRQEDGYHRIRNIGVSVCVYAKRLYVPATLTEKNRFTMSECIVFFGLIGPKMSFAFRTAFGKKISE